MNDTFLLLTPVLMLPIVALLGFVGCDKLLGFEHIPDPQPGPTNFTATAGDGRVDLSWDAYSGATEFHVFRGEVSGDYPDKFLVAASGMNAPPTTYADMTAMNGRTYYYVVTAVTSSGESNRSDEVTAEPIATTVDFVTAFTVGTPANTFNGWAGMEVTVAGQSLDIHALGRVYAAGDVHQHTLKIIDKATLTDVASVTLDTAGGTVSQMQTVPLVNPVTLNQNTTYYIVSQETTGADLVFMDDSTVQTTGVASVINAISGDGVTFFNGTPGYHCFGPLTFKYSVTP